MAVGMSYPLSREDLAEISSISFTCFTHLQFSGIFLPHTRKFVLWFESLPTLPHLQTPVCLCINLTAAPRTWAVGNGGRCSTLLWRLPSAIEWLLFINPSVFKPERTSPYCEENTNDKGLSNVLGSLELRSNQDTKSCLQRLPGLLLKLG